MNDEVKVMEQKVQEQGTKDNVVVLPTPATQEKSKTSKKEVFVGILGILGILSIIAQAIIWLFKGAKKLFKKIFKKEEEPKKEEEKKEEKDFNPDDYEDDGPVDQDDSEEK